MILSSSYIINVSFPFVNGPYGAMLKAIAALQTVVLAYCKGLSLVDGSLRTGINTGATAYAIIAYLVAFRLPLGITHGEIVA